MKILHVIATFDLAMGGPSRIAMRLAAGAAALGHEVATFSYDAGPEAQKAIEEDWRSIPGADLVRHEWLPKPTRIERLLAAQARRALNDLIPGFDVVHTHDVWSTVGRVAMSLAVRHGVPFVLLPNGMLDAWSLQQKWWKKQLVLAAGYRKTLNQAMFFQAGNSGEKEGIEQAGFTRPIEIVPNGVYQQEFDPLPEPGLFFKTHPKLTGRRFILFLGRVHHKKGLDYLASAFAAIAAKHPDVDLVIAGPDEGAVTELRQITSAAGLQSRLHIVGPIFNRDRYHAVVDSACFCLPSRQEGFSVAVLEAMACARPVVISDACHFPEVAETGSGKVVPLDVTAVAAALDEVLSDPRAASRMGQTGRKLVLEQFTWPRLAARLVAAYEKHLSTVE